MKWRLCSIPMQPERRADYRGQAVAASLCTARDQGSKRVCGRDGMLPREAQCLLLRTAILQRCDHGITVLATIGKFRANPADSKLLHANRVAQLLDPAAAAPSRVCRDADIV